MGAFAGQTQQAEEEFVYFFEESVDLLCVAGLDGYFKRLNPAWTKLLGWPLEQLTIKPFLDFVHRDDREATTAEIDSLASGAAAILFENRYRHQDGSYRWLQWTARLAPGRRLIYAIGRDLTRQKWLEREILETADREQERLGWELHDGLCQSLAGIAALSAALSKNLAEKAERTASAAAAEIAHLLNETIGEARDMARGLGPVGRNGAGLAGALETLALDVEHLFKVSCTLVCDGPFVGIPYETTLHLFRIAQEAVHNAVTHGRADRIEIRLSRRDGKSVLSIRDNGVGISENARTVDGIGLHTMASRARLIGGSLKVRRCTPQGTAVTCVFPPPEISDVGDSPHHVRNDT
jgi:PAS domain S-box-containing protein